MLFNALLENYLIKHFKQFQKYSLALKKNQTKQLSRTELWAVAAHIAELTSVKNSEKYLNKDMNSQSVKEKLVSAK